MSQFQIWEARWAALNAMIEQVLDELEAPDSEMLPRRQTLYWLVRSLQTFAADQFEFFQEGFSDNGKFELQPSEDYPEDFVFRTTLEQVGNDLAVIEQIVKQRRDNRSVWVGNRELFLNQRLHQADRLAQLALEPAVEAGLIGKTAVVTYFQKSPSIRVLPYASVALIAIPYASIGNDRDLLAIPHEVGHYVYRHGRSLRHELEQLIPRRPAWRRRWLEEIFSDVYGALVAGPVLALSFQELLMSKPVAEFMQDQSDHPVPFLRPYIYHTVLEKMEQKFGQEIKFSNEIKGLKEHWKKARSTRGLPEGFVPQEDEQETVAEKKAEGYLEHAITIMMGKVDTRHQSWYANLDTVKVAKDLKFAEKLYANFSQKVVDLTNQPVLLHELFVQNRDGAQLRIVSGIPAGASMTVRSLETAVMGGNGHSNGHETLLVEQKGTADTREAVGVSNPITPDPNGNDELALANIRPLGTTNTWIDQIKLIALGKTITMPDAQPAKFASIADTGIPYAPNQPILLPPHVWVSILSTDGWNTGGPENEWKR